MNEHLEKVDGAVEDAFRSVVNVGPTNHRMTSWLWGNTDILAGGAEV